MSNRIVHTKEEVIKHIDFSSGELKEESSIKEITRYVDTPSHFILVYLEDLSGLLRLDNLSDVKVLACVWEMSEMGTGEVILVKSKKEKIAQKTGLSYRVVEVCISRLAKKELIIKADEGRSGLYIINPKWFWKGKEISRKETKKQLQLLLTYQIGDDEEIPSDNESRE
jgi:predicted transcriptional regulator